MSMSENDHEAIQSFTSWVEEYYGKVGEMPKTTFGEWRANRILMNDTLKLQKAQERQVEVAIC